MIKITKQILKYKKSPNLLFRPLLVKSQNPPWMSNLIVAQSFLSLTQVIETSLTFMIFIVFVTIEAIY